MEIFSRYFREKYRNIMQDLDFSLWTQPRIRNHSEKGPSTTEPHFSSKEASHPSTRPASSSRNVFTTFLAAILLSFAVGIAVGVFITKTREIEKNIVSRSDDMRSEYNPSAVSYEKETSSDLSSADKHSFTNMANGLTKKTAKPEITQAPFLIKVGVYPIHKAQEVTEHINQLPQLKNVKAYHCKNIQRKADLNQLAFNLSVPNDQQQKNVFLGCFANKDKALNFLGQILVTSIPQAKSAKLYEIQN